MKTLHIILLAVLAQADLGTCKAPPSATDSEAEAKRDSVAEMIQEPIRTAHAWQIKATLKMEIPEFKAQLAPLFSLDSESVMLIGKGGGMDVVSLRDYEVIETWEPAASPLSMAWAPDGKRLAYVASANRNGSRCLDLHIVDWTDKKENVVPLTETVRYETWNAYLAWPTPEQLFCVSFSDSAIHSINPRTMKVETFALANNSAEREKQIAVIFKSPEDHPYCEIYLPNGRGSSSVFVREKDKSYARQILKSDRQLFDLYVSPNLRHVLLGAGGDVLMHCIVGMHTDPKPEMTFSVDIHSSDKGDTILMNANENTNKSQPVMGTVCAPSIDFTTHEVLGPNKNIVNGTVRVVKKNSTFATVAVAEEINPIKEGDVVVFDSNIGPKSKWRILHPLTGSIEQDAKPALASNPVKVLAAIAPDPTATPSATPVVQTVALQSAVDRDSVKRLTASDINGLSLVQVQHAINEIYGRYGVEFPNKAIQQWANSQPWYHRIAGRTPEIAEAMFSDNEKFNIELMAARRDALKAVK